MQFIMQFHVSNEKEELDMDFFCFFEEMNLLSCEGLVSSISYLNFFSYFPLYLFLACLVNFTKMPISNLDFIIRTMFMYN